MPFPVDNRFIEQAEKELNVIFPPLFKAKMMQLNGGELSTNDDDWILYPFFDQSSTQRIGRTCNHIVLENKHVQEWENFPHRAIAIGDNGCGDHLILLTQERNCTLLDDTVYIWRHEEEEIEHVAMSIAELIKEIIT